MLYMSHSPAPPFGDFVEYFWLLNDAPGHSRERIVPSGTLELVINLREDEIRVYDACGRTLAGVSRAPSCRALTVGLSSSTRKNTQTSSACISGRAGLPRSWGGLPGSWPMLMSI